MKDESQINEMRAALRGDRERAEEARRRSTENVLGLIAPPLPGAVPEQQPAARRIGFLSRLLGR